MKKRKVLSMILAAAMAFGVTGCSTIDDASSANSAASSSTAAVTPAVEVNTSAENAYVGSEDEVYYMVAFMSGHPFWVGCYEGAKDAAKQLGVTIKYTGDPEYDITKSVSAFEQVVAMEPDGVLLTCITPDAFVEPINNAMAAGVPVITYDSDSPDSNRLTFCSTDNVYLGGYCCDYVAESLLENATGIVGITGRPDQLNIRDRMDGFESQAAENYPGIEIAGIVDNKGDVTTGTAAISAMIQANPDMAAIFAADGTGAAAAAQAVKDLNRQDIKIMTVDSTQDILDLIIAGELYGTIAQNTYNMGYWAMMNMYAYTHGLTDPFSDWKEAGNSPLPPYINTGVDVVTAENVQSFVVEATD